MCIQSYYNQKQENDEEIELDLLKEIKDIGIDEWNEQVSEEAEKNSSKSKNK